MCRCILAVKVLGFRGRRARFERAIVDCAIALLRDDEHSVRDALAVLREVTGASAVFVERNVEHPELGLCSTLVDEVCAPGVQPDDAELWAMVPWTEMPAAFARLSQGRAFEFRPEDLPEVEQRRYAGTGVRSELDIPIFVGDEWIGMVGFSDVHRATHWTEAERSLLRTAAEMIGRHWETTDGRRRLTEVVDTLDRQLRYQSVLAESSRRLLSGGGDGAIDAVLEALLDASGADYVYVDRNYDDPELGLCCEIVHEASREGVTFGPRRWTGGPYRDLPTTYDRLARGLPSFILTRELTGHERAQYEADGLLAELNLPIEAEGRWVGSIAFASYSREQHWDDAEVELLRTAAEMIGAYWTRTEQNRRLAKTLVRLEDRYRLEQALTRSARALLNDEPTAIDDTIRELQEATGVDLVYVDENYEDPDRGLCWRVTHHVGAAARPPGAGVWEGPYEDLPTVRAALSAGRPAVVHTETLTGREREIYDEDGVRSELSLPIRVDGIWRGSLGLDHYDERRDWTAEDVELLSAAAEMVGAYWHRQETRERLEALISSKDEFLASVGHELRTPLTSVLGFAEILVGDEDRLSAAERREMLELIAREARDAAWIIEDLLVFARADLGRLQVAPAVVSLLAEAEAVVKSLRVDVPIEIRGGDRKAWADAARVRQIVRNLLTNAVKYGGDHIAVEVADGPDGPVLAVLDDGEGIPADLEDLVFQPYVRLREEQGRPGSMGLGLSVSRQLARLLGGDLRYVRRGPLSSFELTLPSPPQPKR